MQLFFRKNAVNAAIHSVKGRPLHNFFLKAVQLTVFPVKLLERLFYPNPMTLTLQFLQFNAVNSAMFSIQRRYNRFFPVKGR